tara:strand:+ start:383 stop:1360 length:978 start_codon:yes stop_codon:yes gene_type:complete
MANQNKTTLKGYFETGDIPNQNQYGDLIDSNLNLSETGTQIILGTISASVFATENFIVGHITASGGISASGDLEIGGNITASGATSIIKAATGSFSNIQGNSPITIKDNVSFESDISVTGTIAFASSNAANLNLTGLLSASVISSSGNIKAHGVVEAGDYKLDGVTLATTFTELNHLDGLTSGEATQIKNIGSNAISATEWSYVAGNNQFVTTTSSPTFVGVNLTKTAYGTAMGAGDTINTEASKAFTLSKISVPELEGLKLSGNYLVNNEHVDTTSVIHCSMDHSALMVNTGRQISGQFQFYFFNPTQATTVAVAVQSVNCVIL